MGNTTEIEIQFQVENSEALISFLQKVAQFTGEKHQVDAYYTPAHRQFIKVKPIKEWLRLRKSSGKFSINYKNWHYEKDGKSHYADEYESEIKDLRQLTLIFKALNMKKIVTVDKVRKTWIYKDYEIAIDSIKNLGDFVEIEYKGKSTKQNPAAITAQMIEFLKKFNPGKISRNYVGYPFQILFPTEVTFEIFK